MRVDQLRISGFSGLDTESMVKKLMDAQKPSLYRLQQQKQLAEWKRSEFRDVNSLLLELRNAAEGIRMQSSFQKKAGTSTNDSIVKVTGASNSAMEGVHKITVKQLATAASLTSGKVDNEYKTESAQTFSINGKEITVASDTDMKGIAAAINAKKGETGVQVNYDEANQRFFFMNSKTGGDSEITIGDMDAGLKDALNLSTLSATGTQAIINYNGTDLEFASNNVSVNGLTLDLKSANVNAVVDVTVGKDTKSAFESIVKFVDKYNEVIEKLNAKLGEEKKKGITPLSEEDREKLSEKQIELWEKNAKSGIIRNDPIISSALSQMRNDLSSSVKLENGDFLSMFAVGFSTGDYTQKGKLILDVDKLQEALNTSPDKVMDLFSNFSSSANVAEKHQGTGLAERIFQTVNKTIASITSKAGSSTSVGGNDLLSQEIKQLDRKIFDFEDKLYQMENRYWKQFSAMESAMNKANAQSGWLASMFYQ